MLSQLFRRHKATLFVTFLAAALAAGWAGRERAHAEEKAKLLASRTVNAPELKTAEAPNEGKPTGHIALYFDGMTAGTRNFVTGRFSLNPATEPHPPHRHPEEEILIV